MAKPFSKAEADEGLRSRLLPRDLLKRLPDDVDAPLAARRVLDLISDGHHAAWALGRVGQHIPASVIRAALVQLPNEPRTAERVFLMEAVKSESNDVALKKSWVAALQALLDLSLTYAWGSKERKAKLRALAQRPIILAAIQAAVVAAAEQATIDMLAVLAIDASEASLDALLPVFANGKHHSRLEMLAVHATKNAAMKALLESATTKREAKEAASSATAFVSRLLGIEPPLKSVKCMVWLSSEELNRNNVPRIQGALSLDSRWDAWWSVHLTRVDGSMDMKTTRFGAGEDHARDQLGLGRSTIEDLPKWLVGAAKKLKIKWNTKGLASGSLRGKKRERFTDWVFDAD